VFQRRTRPTHHIALQIRAGLFGEVLGQFEDVAFALTQRRQLDRELREAVVQVLAEFAFADQRRQIAVGRGDDPHIDFVGVVGTQRTNLAFLQHAQNLRLQRQRHVADLVEQQRAAIGRIEQPRDGRGRRR
jgi:hypothetical protein